MQARPGHRWRAVVLEQNIAQLSAALSRQKEEWPDAARSCLTAPGKCAQI
jgi:hypothetical protein